MKIIIVPTRAIVSEYKCIHTYKHYIYCTCTYADCTACFSSTVHMSLQPGSSKVVTMRGRTPRWTTHRAPFLPCPLTVTKSISHSEVMNYNGAGVKIIATTVYLLIYRTLIITLDTLLGNFRCSNTTDTPVL